MNPARQEEGLRLPREEVWARNCDALAARDPGADLLPPLPEGAPALSRVEVVPGSWPVLRVKGEKGAAVTLHSPRRPLEEARELAARAPRDPGGGLAALGLGAGYHLLALLPLLPPDADLLVLEPDPEVWWAALATVDLTPLLSNPRVRLAVGQEVPAAVAWLKAQRQTHPAGDIKVFGHPPSLRARPTYYRRVLEGLRPSARPAVVPRGLKKEHLRVLLINPDYFLIPEVVRAFRQLGHQAELLLFDKRREPGEEVLHRILRRLGDSPPDLVFTVNHLGFDREGVLLAALERLRLPSVSWYVDSPAIILSLYDGPRSDLACIFVWDPTYIPTVQAMGFSRVFPLPLATDPEVFRPRTTARSREAQGRVVFVGNSMVGTVRQKFARLPETPAFQELWGKLSPAFQARPGRSLAALLEELHLQDHPGLRGLDRQGRTDLEAALLWCATRDYRLACIRPLAPFAPVIYGDPGWGELTGPPVVLRPELNYYDELPGVYRAAAVNFNATSLQMKAAVNQRVFDVPAAGGFLVTDFREQLAECFDLGREMVCYQEPGEIPEVVRFYLRRPELRRKTVRRARRRVLAEHTYRHRVAALLETLRRTL
jgi:spore maturation protein CgeB